VAGALGRTGSAVCEALARAPGLQLVGGYGRRHAGELLGELLGLPGHAGLIYTGLDELFREAQPEVVVDFTVHPVTIDVAFASLARGASPVIGATGWTHEELQRLDREAASRGAGAIYAPNFALGAVLMMQFAEKASRFFEKAEIVEFHHDRKLDAPSGTAKLTAERMQAAGGRHVPVHSVRLPGLVAHQEVILGARGQTLTIRHDSLSRESFADGVVLAVRRVRERPGLTIGLDALIEAP
jgi:4-hydroxy-tetrahydrodipicolinate reductase